MKFTWGYYQIFALIIMLIGFIICIIFFPDNTKYSNSMLFIGVCIAEFGLVCSLLPFFTKEKV
jgi:hypothetical protein